MHHFQRQRLNNINTIREWIQKAGGPEAMDEQEIIRKAMLVLGCSRAKAMEYIQLINGDEGLGLTQV